MKCFCLPIVLIVLLSQPLRAEVWVPHGSLTLSLQEKMIKPRLSRVLHDKPSLVGDFTLELPQGFFVNARAAYGFDDNTFSSNNGDEYEGTVGWKGKIAEAEFKFSVNYLNLYPLEDSQLDILAGTFAVGKPFKLSEWYGNHIVRPEFRVDWVSTPTEIENGALVLMPNVSHTWQKPFGIEPLTFFHQFSLVWNDKFRINSDEGIFLHWNAGLKWKLSENVSLTLPSILLIEPLTNPHDGRESVHSLGAGITFSF